MFRRLVFTLLIALTAASASAQEALPPAAPTTMPEAGALSLPAAGSLENLPPMDARALDDGAPIRLSPDGPAVINLDRDAGTVIVGNPNHATAVMENPRMIMLMPGAPGATKIIALDREGKSILNRHVLVGSGKKDFMRINRVCALGGDGCMPQSVYYCPDKCYETTVNTSGGNTTAGGAASAGPAPMPELNPEDSATSYQETVE